MLSDAEIVVRLVTAAAMGGAVGLERQLSDEVAGFRTHLLVAMGACLFGLVSVLTSGDTRIAAQVVSGVGFLGAGAILRRGTNVFGVATAASLWVVAAVGLASAFGYWLGALVAAVLAVVTLHSAKRFEANVLRRFRSKRAQLSLRLGSGQDLAPVVQRITDTGVLCRGVQVTDKGSGQEVVLSLEMRHGLMPAIAADAVRPIAEVRELTWTA
jgi:putative Mg2+ transporter-C (MgtC) family protein